MLVYIFKRIQVIIWENLSKRRLIKKFRLYGPYKSMYSWDKYTQMKEHIALFKPLNHRINTEWYKYFTLIRQQEDPAILPEDIWHICLEPVLNHRSYAKAFNDKNLYDFTKYRHLLPKTYLHIIQGAFYGPEYQQLTRKEAEEFIPGDESFVCKQVTDSGGGSGVVFYKAGQNKDVLSKIIREQGQDVVIQQTAKQHKWFSDFNSDSVNTIRVVTYRSVKDEKVHVVQTLLRIGKLGSKVDNQSSGGIAVGIDEKGRLNNWGCDKLSNRFTEINGIKLAETDTVPNFDLLKSTCCEIARYRVYERVLVFDTWQDEDNNIRLVEINNVNLGIEDLQKNNGPLFGKFTKEVIDWCSNHERTYCFDFKLKRQYI